MRSGAELLTELSRRLSFVQHRMVLFLKSADSATVVHEFFHHIRTQGLIPKDAEARLLKSVGMDKWNTPAEEAVANALTAYIAKGTLPTTGEAGATLKDLESMRRSLRAYWKDHLENVWELNADTEAWFKGVFAKGDEAISEQEAGVARAVDAVMKTTVLNQTQGIEKARANKRAAFHIAMRDFNETEGQDAREYLISSGYKGYALAKNSNGTQTSDMTDEELIKAVALLSTDDVMIAQGDKMSDRRRSRATRELAIEYAKSISEDPTERKEIVESLMKGIEQGKAFEELIEGSGETTEQAGFRKFLEVDLEARKELANDEAEMLADRISTQANHYGMKTREAGGGTLWRKIADTARRVMNFVTNPETLFKWMDNGNANGLFTQLFWNRLDKATKQYASNMSSAIERISASINEMGGIPANMHEQVDVKGGLYTKSQLVGIYMHSQGGNLSHKSTQALMENNPNVTSETILEAKRIVEADPELMNYIKVVQGYMGNVWGRLSSVAQKVLGREIGNLGQFYLPFVFEDGNSAEVGGLQALENLDPNMGLTPEERLIRTPSQVKKRTNGKGGTLDLDSLKIFLRYMETAENYIAKAEQVQHMVNMLDNSNLESMIRTKYSDDTYSTLRQMIVREMSPTGRQGSFMKGESAFRMIRSKAVASFLGMNPFTILKQPVSLWNAMTMLEVKATVGNFMGALMFATRNIKLAVQGSLPMAGNADYERMVSESPVMKLRAQQGLVDPEFENMKSQRYGTTALQDFARDKGWLSVVVNRGLSFIRMADMVTVTAVYTTARDASLAEGKTQEEAIAFAEHVVRKSQPPTTVSERNLMQTSNEYVRSAIPFSGQLFKNLNMYLYDIVMPVIGAYKGQDGSRLAKMAESGKTLWNTKRTVLFAVAVPSVVLGMIARRRPQEDLGEVMLDLFAYPLATFPLLGAGISRGLQGYDSDAYQAIWLDCVNAVNRTAVDAMKFDMDWSNVKDVEQLTLLLSGMPQYPARLINNLIEAMTDSGSADSFPEVFELVRATFDFESKESRK